MRRLDGAGEVEAAAERAAASPWTRRLSRLGFASKALVYAVVASLALAVAAHAGGRTTDTRGALASLAEAPWGRVLVALLAAGLACHALWFVLLGVADPGRHRRDAKGLLVRAGRVLAGLAHGALAATALQLALPAGTALVLLGGAIAIAVGVVQIRRGLRCRRHHDLRTGEMGPRLRRWAPRLGLAGLVSQGTVVLLAGVFFVQAGLERDPREATGFDGALAWLARQPYGSALLAAAALGLLAYAAWTAIEARYRPMHA